jgi:hypothetical protein
MNDKLFKITITVEIPPPRYKRPFHHGDVLSFGPLCGVIRKFRKTRYKEYDIWLENL